MQQGASLLSPVFGPQPGFDVILRAVWGQPCQRCFLGGLWVLSQPWKAQFLETLVDPDIKLALLSTLPSPVPQSKCLQGHCPEDRSPPPSGARLCRVSPKHMYSCRPGCVTAGTGCQGCTCRLPSCADLSLRPLNDHLRGREPSASDQTPAPPHLPRAANGPWFAHL